MQTAYHSKYFAYELTKKCSSDSLEKFAAIFTDAQVDLNPHQVDSALFAFKSPLSKGALLADEVGLGKTIEAGIVLSQKWAERKRKILIIVPANLRKQWNQELIDKFFLPSMILESKSFNDETKKKNYNPFLQNNIIICSYQFARSKENYIQGIDWDLIVIDEAHRLRNVYKKTSKIASSIKTSINGYPSLLLTATPLQNSLLELYGLVSIIDEYAFGDLKSFKSKYSKLTGDDNFDELKKRLTPVCKRHLRRQVNEYINFTKRIAITEEFSPTTEEQNLYNIVSDYLQRPNLYALPASQRKLMTLILRKLLASSTFAISGTLESLYNKLNARIESQEGNENSIEEKIAEDYEGYEEIKDEWLDDDDELDVIQFYDPEEIPKVKEERDTLKEFSELAKAIEKNSKGDKLLTALEKGFEKLEELGANKKAIIFTESRRTQDYLKSILEKTEYKGKIVIFNGTNTDIDSKKIYKDWLEKNKNSDKVTGSKTADTRAAIVDYFKDTATIMIATEAAAEGINLQFCSMVVNYDLPWNPQRIEQRIGRCHRYGQKHDVIVVNFLNKKNAADQRVYQLLSDKFKLFDGVFGVSDEVLGSIESGVDFEKRIAEIYLNCRTEQAIKESFDQLQKDLEPEIDEKILQTKQKLLEHFDEEVSEKLKIRSKECNEYLDKYEECLWKLAKFSLKPYATFKEDNYSFYLNNNPFSNENIPSGPYRIGKNIQDAHKFRVGHPLAQKIIDKCKTENLEEVELIFNYSDTPKKITILEDFVGKSGWLTLKNLSITSFETEDHLIFAGLCENETILDNDQCRRLFSLPAELKDLESKRDLNLIRIKLDKQIYEKQSIVLQENAERNALYFDDEMEKLDKWADDMKNSLEIELKDLEKDIKTRKTEARKISKLEDKVKAQREIKDLEKKRKDLRMNIYKAQDEVDTQKDSLIEDMEQKLSQNISIEELFLIRWRII